MKTLSARVNAYANGVPRGILTIKESKKGDVYIRIKSGIQAGIPPNHTSNRQDRFSIHPSPNSARFNTLKMTAEAVDGRKTTSTALTNAVKEKSGFFHLFTLRCSDLDHELFDVDQELESDIKVSEYNPSDKCLLLSLFICSKDSTFNIIDISPEIIIIDSNEF